MLRRRLFPSVGSAGRGAKFPESTEEKEFWASQSFVRHPPVFAPADGRVSRPADLATRAINFPAPSTGGLPARDISLWSKQGIQDGRSFATLVGRKPIRYDWRDFQSTVRSKAWAAR